MCEGGRLRASRRLPPFASPAALHLAPLRRAAEDAADLVRYTFTFSVLTQAVGKCSLDRQPADGLGVDR